MGLAVDEVDEVDDEVGTKAFDGFAGTMPECAKYSLSSTRFARIDSRRSSAPSLAGGIMPAIM